MGCALVRAVDQSSVQDVGEDLRLAARELLVNIDRRRERRHRRGGGRGAAGNVTASAGTPSSATSESHARVPRNGTSIEPPREGGGRWSRGTPSAGNETRLTGQSKRVPASSRPLMRNVTLPELRI